jgi:hypothetical protein
VKQLDNQFLSSERLRKKSSGGCSTRFSLFIEAILRDSQDKKPSFEFSGDWNVKQAFCAGIRCCIRLFFELFLRKQQ